MEKYYKPSIEEFCVGFEFEYKIERWTKHTLVEKDFHSSDNGGWGIDSNFEVMKRSELRVRILDFEEIINLGWDVQTNETPGGIEARFCGRSISYYNKKCNDLRLTHSKYTNELAIYFVNVNMPIRFQETFNLFFGKIKNKTELRLLMNHLGIKFESSTNI